VSGFAHIGWSAYRETFAEFGRMLDGEGLKLTSIDVESAVYRLLDREAAHAFLIRGWRRETKKEPLTALLTLFFGIFGALRFYAGKTASAVVQLLTLGGLGI
jgi:hypothetical protein